LTSDRGRSNTAFDRWPIRIRPLVKSPFFFKTAGQINGPGRQAGETSGFIADEARRAVLAAIDRF
jgi:hypothetical protein